MPTLVAAYTRISTWRLYIGGQLCAGVLSLKTSQNFGSGIGTATIVLRNPPVTPAIGTTVKWEWGYNGQHKPGFTGEIARPARKSYPNRYTIECRDVLWRADRSDDAIATSPLNTITASAAVRYLLTHYGGISSSRISLPTFSASGAAWAGSEWTLGILTPVQWGDTDTNSGGKSALKAAQEICSVLGYWLYADASGIIRAKQMERAPSTSAVHTFQRGIDLLTDGNPELVEDVDAIKNKIVVMGGNTGIDGAQISDTWQTSSPILPPGVYQRDTFSSFLIEYENATDAGAASATEIAKRILKLKSRLPIIVRHRVKADPRLSVGATVGIIDSAIGMTTAKNFFIYELETSLDCVTGNFSQQMTLDGGIGSGGYTTVPPPDASFSWRLVAETVGSDAIVEVFLDGSGSASLTGGEIVSWAWSTSTTTYSGSPSSATGETACLIFLASASPATISLTVTDTTSKTGTIEQTIDLTGADTATPLRRALHVAFGAAWEATPDGGATWNVETSNGDAIAVGTIGAGVDVRSAGTGGTYGIVATRGTGGAGGLRQSLDLLASASTNLVSNSGAITSNIWVNEANPARVWFAIGTAVYRSIDGGVTKTAMHVAPGSVAWIMEDPAVDNSVFLLAGANMYNATDPTVGWALLYAGPLGATARQFVRSRDGQVTWICYTGAPSGEALQRVETGALADIAVTDIRTLALDNAATSLLATLWAVTADTAPQIWSFDGLTGLSAAQATPTLPSGATAMHMLADPDAPVYYIADFDSVVAGTGAVRKFLADQLFLFRAGATGRQAHMLGLAVGASGAIELVLLPRGQSGGNDKIWHYRDGAWAGLTPPFANAYWNWISASPFNPDHWLLFGNTTSSNTNFTTSSSAVVTNSGALAPAWLSTDAGLTWTALPIPDDGASGPFTLNIIEWSAVTFGAFFVQGYTGVAGAIPDPTAVTRVWRGFSTTASASQTITPYIGAVAQSGQDDDVVISPYESTSPQYDVRIMDSGGSASTPSGAAPPSLGISDIRPLTRQFAACNKANTAIYGAADYRANQPSSIASGLTSADAVAWGGAVLYVTGAPIVSITDPFGSPVVATAYDDGRTYRFIRSDRQSQSIVAASADDGGGGVRFAVWSGTAWVVVGGPVGVAYTDVGRHEVIVR